MKKKMILNIARIQTVGEIQKLFAHCYPYLKMQFGSTDQLSGAKYLTPEHKIVDIIKSVRPKIIDIRNSVTIRTLEKAMENVFEVKLEILRKSGNTWTGTSLTKDWTLKKQNSEAEQINPAYEFVRESNEVTDD